MGSDEIRVSYLVTARFRVYGNPHHHLSDEHLKSNIAAAVDEGVGEIEFSGEWYDSQEDWVDALFQEGYTKVELKEFSVSYSESPFCEHCGERHQDFGIMIGDGGTYWCFSCFLSGDGSDFFSEKEIEEMWAEEKRLRKEFYKKKLKEMDDD